jgi:quercetin dioxygenase-like cupin family protein
MLAILEDKTTHHFSDGLYAKEMHVPKDFLIQKHTHSFNHLSILAQGKVVVIRGEEPIVLEAPACLEIEKEVIHGIRALTDCVWFCIHATDEKDSSKVDKVLIEKKE